MDCRTIRRLIDEADAPDRVPIEASRHTDSCADCRSFADERARLRALLRAPSRVTVPANFDTLLSLKLAERTSHRSVSWFAPANMLRLGGAVATVLVAVFLGQLYLTGSRTPGPGPIVGLGDPVKSEPAMGPVAGSPEEHNNVSGSLEALVTPPKPAGGKRGERQLSRSARDYEMMRAAAVLLMRDPSSDRQVTVSAITVGAQPILSVDSDSSRARIVRTSF
jgi:hypothetical protein